MSHIKSMGKCGADLGEFNNPASLTIQPFTHHLIVCDEDNCRLQFLLSDPDHSSSSSKTTVLYVVGRKCEVRSEAKGNFFRPSGVCCATNGDLIVADTFNDQVQILDAAGRFVTRFGSHGKEDGNFEFPCSVHILHRHFSPSSAASSMLLVGDHHNKRVSIWSQDGRQHLSNLSVAGYARALCVDLNGYLHVSCGEMHNSVQIFDPRNSFTMVQQLGEIHGDLGAERGEFYYPTGMCVDGQNTLMVCDTGNHRVQFFPMDPR